MDMACPHCGQVLEIEADTLGMEAECPACSNTFVAEAKFCEDCELYMGKTELKGMTLGGLRAVVNFLNELNIQGAADIALCGLQQRRFWNLKVAAGLLAIMFISWLSGGWPDTAFWHAERIVSGIIGGMGFYILITRGIVLISKIRLTQKSPNLLSSLKN